MIIFLSIVGAFLVWFTVQSRRYNNPYRLIFIFGKKGAGKSLYMVKQMMKYLKKGWTVYTDIDNCKLPGVRIMKAMDLQSSPLLKTLLFSWMRLVFSLTTGILKTSTRLRVSSSSRESINAGSS